MLLRSRSRVLLSHFLPSRVAGSPARRAFSATTTTSAGASSSLEIVQFPVLSDNYGEATTRGRGRPPLTTRGSELDWSQSLADYATRPPQTSI